MDYWNSVLLISIITMVGLAMIILFVGCKMWKNLVVTLLIATLIGFLIVCAINFVLAIVFNFYGVPLRLAIAILCWKWG